MKKKFLFLAVALMTTVGFTACSDDDDAIDYQVQYPEVYNLDYAPVIDKTINDLATKAGAQPQNVLGLYMITPAVGHAKDMCFSVYNDSIVVSIQMTADTKYVSKAEMREYFSKRYNYLTARNDSDLFYGDGKSQITSNVIIELKGSDLKFISVANIKKASLLKPLAGTESLDPQATIEEFLGKTKTEIESKYGRNSFSLLSDDEYTFVHGNVYMNNTLLYFEDGVVNKVNMEFASYMSNADMIAYFKTKGYTCTETGNKDEDGYPIYSLTNKKAGYQMELSGYECFVWKL